ncbi:MAG TPA: prenyltransferase/squalene oxidase repeat-containing protein [Planctomycetaceae bacterium]|nr:prenyltransferase/squalene oxidase repeat-containing protein [Planctomycetaceae bacterium]
MSANKPDSPSPEKPAWMKSRSEQSPAQTSKSLPPPLKLKRSQPIRIHVRPEDLAEQELTRTQKLVQGIKRSGPGTLVSFVFHALLLIVLALIVITIRQNEADLWFEMGWTPDRTGANARVRGPADVGSFIVQDNAPKQRAPLKLPNEQSGSENADADKNSSGVKPVDVQNLLNNRSDDRRQAVLEQHGGSPDAERAVKNALLWLKRNQRDGGNWSLHDGYPNAGERTMRTDTGATALALLAFLGAGHTHQFGDHRETVGQALEWLSKNQRDDGNFHDRYDQGHQSTFYAHSQAVIALCECFALTKDEELREPIERGLNYLIDAQNPVEGGWKYRPSDEKTVGDLSVTGWALMALHTARAAGFDVPSDCYLRADGFLDSVQEQQGTRYKYMPSDPADRVTATMTAEGLLCRQFLGTPRDHLGMTGGVKWLLSDDNIPEWKEGRRNVYEWYYTAQTLHNLGGPDWIEWYQSVAKQIVLQQRSSGSTKPGEDVRGSWDPDRPRGAYHEYADQAGRLYLTCMSVLILETPYRHAPIYDRAEQIR